MSRVGKKPVAVPGGVKVNINDRLVKVEGSKGSLSFQHRPEISVTWDEGAKQLGVDLADGVPATNRQAKALWGTTRSLLSNMVEGVSKGFEKKLEIVGVGWNAQSAGKTLKLQVGYANTVELPIPDGVAVAVEKQSITLSGADKQAVGQFAAVVRSVRKPEPYNGKGVRYADEVIRRKQGKQFGK